MKEITKIFYSIRKLFAYIYNRERKAKSRRFLGVADGANNRVYTRYSKDAYILVCY